MCALKHCCICMKFEHLLLAYGFFTTFTDKLVPVLCTKYLSCVLIDRETVCLLLLEKKQSKYCCYYAVHMTDVIMCYQQIFQFYLHKTCNASITHWSSDFTIRAAEDSYLLRCEALLFGKYLPQFEGACCLHFQSPSGPKQMTLNLDYYMGPDLGGGKLLQNVDNYLQINVASYTRRLESLLIQL